LIFRLVLSILLGCFLAGRLVAAPTFDAYQVALHLQRCTARPVFFLLPLAADLSSDVLPPCEKDPLTAWLSPRGLKLIWEDDALLIKSAQVFYPVATWQDWSDIRLDVTVRNPAESEKRKGTDFDGQYKFVPVRRDLPNEQLQAASQWILRNVPMPPLALPAYCPTCGDPPHTATVRLEIVLEGVTLSHAGGERIIGRISGNQTSRILIGQFADGRFHLDWISPLLEPRGQVLTYRDVNADGVGEIWSLSAERSSGDEVWMLSIFDLQGRELTRDVGECDWAVSSELAASPLAAACPIVGVPGIGHFVMANGKVTIEAARDFKNHAQPRRVYELIGEKYAPAKSANDR
jgi:hypothetical protein